MLRSKNTGIGITDPDWLSNIKIIGIRDVILQGAENPIYTGDGNRTLVSSTGKGRVSYCSDAGKGYGKPSVPGRINNIHVRKKINKKYYFSKYDKSIKLNITGPVESLKNFIRKITSKNVLYRDQFHSDHRRFFGNAGNRSEFICFRAQR